MPLSAYIPHLIYSTALTSISFHLLFQKKQSEVDHAHLNAQISILESLAHRLRSRQEVSDEEIERLCKLAKTHEESNSRGAGTKIESVGWKDVFLGRKSEEDARERERKELEESQYLGLYICSALVFIFHSISPARNRKSLALQQNS